jgi:hypothetical protein
VTLIVLILLFVGDCDLAVQEPVVDARPGVDIAALIFGTTSPGR